MNSYQLTLSEIIKVNVTKRVWVINDIENTSMDLTSLTPGMTYAIVLANENKYRFSNQSSPVLMFQTGDFSDTWCLFRAVEELKSGFFH